MLPCSLTLLNHAVGDDKRLRAKAVSWWTAAGAISIAAGPVIGSLLLASLGWRSIFLVNLPVCVLGALLTRKVEETEAERRRPRLRSARPGAGHRRDGRADRGGDRGRGRWA